MGGPPPPPPLPAQMTAGGVPEAWLAEVRGLFAAQQEEMKGMLVEWTDALADRVTQVTMNQEKRRLDGEYAGLPVWMHVTVYRYCWHLIIICVEGSCRPQ